MRINRFNWLFLVGFLLFQISAVTAKGSELGRARFILDVVVGAREGAITYADWVNNFPIPEKSKDSVKRWLAATHFLDSKVEAIRYQKEAAQIYWKSEGENTEMSFKLVSTKPIIFRLNGIEGRIQGSHPSLGDLYNRLEKINAKQKVSWLWETVIPPAEAKKKSLFQKLLIPMLALSAITLPFTIMDIKGKFDKADELEKRYDTDSKAIAETKSKVTKAQVNPTYPYSVSGVNCQTVEGGGRPDPLAEAGKKGFKSFGLNSIRFTPKGKKFGEGDIEVNYSMEGNKRQIKEIRLRRNPKSSQPKNIFENDCLIYSASINEPQKRFLKQCTEEAFPGKNIASLEDFYSSLGNFNLKDHEALAATEPGCLEILGWLTGIPAPPPSQSQGEKPQIPDSPSQNR